MKKILICTISTLSFLVGVFLLWNVGIKFFFNDFLFEAPNLRGLTVNEAQELIGGNFKLVNMGEHYSTLEKGQIYSQLPLSPKHIKKDRPIKVWISKGSDSVPLPDLKGKNLQDARAILNELGIKVKNISHITEGNINNLVVGSDPKSGTLISREEPISLLVNVRSIKSIRMPDILGYNIEEGVKILRDQNLVVGDIKEVYRKDFPKDTVIDVNYSAGDNILIGSVINISVTTNEIKDKNEEE